MIKRCSFQGTFILQSQCSLLLHLPWINDEFVWWTLVNKLTQWRYMQPHVSVLCWRWHLFSYFPRPAAVCIWEAVLQLRMSATPPPPSRQWQHTNKQSSPLSAEWMLGVSEGTLEFLSRPFTEHAFRALPACSAFQSAREAGCCWDHGLDEASRPGDTGWMEEALYLALERSGDLRTSKSHLQ